MPEVLSVESRPGTAPTGPRAGAASSREHSAKPALHRIVVVGGGAAGIELVTQLGDRLGKRALASVTLIECARTHLWKPLLHAVAAGSIDPAGYEIDYLAQARWHGFGYRLGEMVGLDRGKREVHLAPTLDEYGCEITPRRSIGYDTLIVAIGSVTN
jgi:NADH dehydrogenase